MKKRYNGKDNRISFLVASLAVGSYIAVSHAACLLSCSFEMFVEVSKEKCFRIPPTSTYEEEYEQIHVT